MAIEIEPAPARARVSTFSAPATLFLLAFGFMIFQISVLRELRYALNTVFTLTPFVFSIVIVFIGFGSFAARGVAPGRSGILRRAVAILPLLTLPLFAATLFVARISVDRTANILNYAAGARTAAADYVASVGSAFIATALFGFGAMFFLQGLIFALYFREGRTAGTLSQLYAIDLVASGLGALLGGVLSFQFTPIQSALVSALFLLAALGVSREFLNFSWGVVGLEILLVAGMIAAETFGGVLARIERPDYLGPHLVYSTWSPYRRIDVVETPTQLVVYTDGLKFQGYDKNDVVHGSDPRVVPSLLAEGSKGAVRDVLIIGSGTGADVRILRDRIASPLRITAVELDEGFIRTARRFPWLWKPYETADIRVEEGRYFLERSRDTFDMVVYAYIDPQSAISKLGIPDANFLYTDRGLRRAFECVREGGYLVITRIFLDAQSDEFFRRLSATLRLAGIGPSSALLYRSRSSVPWGHYGQIATCLAVIRKGSPPPNIVNSDLVPIAFQSGGRATTDLYPFSLITDAWFGALWRSLSARPVVAVALAALLLLLLVRVTTNLAHFHFFLLGFGSFLVESLVLLASFLLIGNPTLSAALAVGFLLFWSGIGSFYSDWLEKRPALFGLVPLVMLAYGATAPMLGSATIGRSVGFRVVAFAIHLAIPGLLAGAMFPISLRYFRDRQVPSLFFIDLIGCAIAPIAFWLAMSFSGLWLVTALGAGSYAVVAVILRMRTA